MSIDRYKVKQILGEGSSSTVYLAFDTVTQQDVAIKSQNSQTSMEAEIHSRLNYEHIIQLKNFISGERRAFLILEFCDYNLISFINNYDIDHRCILKIIRMVLLATKYLHDRGVIHRDIKLGNILVKNDTIKICDFGLSCYASAGDYSYCGTKDYLAPEITKDGTPYGTPVDIYAVGVVFKVLLCRKKDIPVDAIEQADAVTKEFLRNLLHADPSRRPTADRALRDPIFSQLFTPIPDFRLIGEFTKLNRYGQIVRKGRYISILYHLEQSINNAQQQEELRIEYKGDECICKTAFIPTIAINGVPVKKAFLSSTQLKYLNYLAGYMQIVCARTPLLKIVEDGFVFSCMLNGGIEYADEHARIRWEGSGRYEYNGGKVDALPEEYSNRVRWLLARCSAQRRECVCKTGVSLEQGSTVNLSLGGGLHQKGQLYLPGIGWSVKNGLQFLFLLNDGRQFSVDARQQILMDCDRAYKIDRKLSKVHIEYLKIARGFLRAFLLR